MEDLNQHIPGCQSKLLKMIMANYLKELFWRLQQKVWSDGAADL